MSEQKPTATPETCSCGCRREDDRVVWIAVRRGLLLIVKAIEVRIDETKSGDRAA